MHPSEFDKEKDITVEELAVSASINQISDLVLLEQTGYLTIKKSKGNVLTLGYPNQEVSGSMANLYLEHLLRRGESLTEVKKMNFPLILAKEDISEFVRLINAVFLSIDYHRYFIHDGSSYAGVLLIALRVSGVNASQEIHNAIGRSDIEFTNFGVHWVLVLKFAHKEEEVDKLISIGEKQMEDRQYGEQVIEKRHVRLVMVFSEEKQKFVRYLLMDPAK